MTPPFELLDTPLPPGVTLLEASAGTGKTYALAAIYLRLIAEEGLTVGQIAVTTYTIPATEELRSRIRARLAEAVQVFDGAEAKTPFVAALINRHSADPKVRQLLADALRDFDEACISTIHGFCQRILRERSFESGSLPDTELAPDQSALVREVAEDFWRHHFATVENAAAPLALLLDLTPTRLAKLWESAARQPTATLVPAPDTAAAALQTVQDLLAEFQAQWPAWRPVVQRLFVDAPSWAIGGWKDTIRNAEHLARVDQLAANLLSPLLGYSALRHFRPSHIAAKNGISKRTPLSDFAFGDWGERFAIAAENFAAATRAQFLAWARPELHRRKTAAGLMSFDDLLTRLHDALHRPGSAALLSAVRTRFGASLVDEFQDTDPIQEAIFRRLFAEDPEHRHFLIGDPKQAIYAFRGADLHTYLAARRRAGRVFLLDTNHRSDAALVEAANALFLRPAAPFIDNIEYPPAKAARDPHERKFLIAGTARAPLRFTFWDEAEPIPSRRADAELPAVTAAAIADLLATSTLDGRALKPSEIAVLCWKNAQCQAVQAALATRRIPAVVLSSLNVFASREARDLFVVLSALCRPAHEAAVRAALATSLFGFDAAALDALAGDAIAWETRLALFADAHVQWRDHGFIQMFRHLLRDTHARARLLALADGERRLTNFLHLAEILHTTAREFCLDPAGLLRWFSGALENPSSIDEYEQRLESDDDAVTVLTVHKSKGLEWPVVLCPFLWTKADLQSGIETVFHDERGQPVLDLGSAKRDDARAAAAHERLAEHLRLVYVALTRARHECQVIWGRFRESEISALMWLLEPPELRSAAPQKALTPSSPVDRLAARAESLDSAHLRRTLDHLASSAPASIAVENIILPDPSAPPAIIRHSSSATRPSPPAARPFTTPINRLWRVSSFSSLVAGAEHERDRDFDDRPRLDASQLRGIHAFPRSNRAGICIHEIFEELDFTAPQTLPALVPSKLRQHGLFSEENAASLIECVHHTLAAPLGTATLGSIPPARTLRELEFQLPARLLTPAQLTAAAGAGLQFEPRRGILTGFIDLIFEHEGRYSIVDWKSNHLGATAEAYTAPALQSTMEHHRYGLQWRLYVLALHRFLASRLRDYSMQRHLGGVFYLFLRGITPGRPELGIFHATPTAPEIAMLEKTFLP